MPSSCEQSSQPIFMKAGLLVKKYHLTVNRYQQIHDVTITTNREKQIYKSMSCLSSMRLNKATDINLSTLMFTNKLLFKLSYSYKCMK